MKFLLWIAAWCMATTMPLQAATAEPDTICAGPGIYVDKASFDFGDIDGDKSVTHTFIIGNDGTEPLIIKSVYSNCGCTTAVHATEPVQPGKTTTIAVTFNPVGRPAGFFTKVVRVKTNAGPRALQLFVKGRIRH